MCKRHSQLHYYCNHITIHNSGGTASFEFIKNCKRASQISGQVRLSLLNKVYVHSFNPINNIFKAVGVVFC